MPIMDGFDPIRDMGIGAFTVRSAVVRRGQHILTMGALFRGTNSQQPLQESVVLSNNDSVCLWLQNAAGRAQWPVTDEKVSHVVTALMPTTLIIG